MSLTKRGRAIEWRTDSDLAHTSSQLQPLRKRQEITIGQRPLHAKAIERRPTNAPSRRPFIAFNQTHNQIHRRIAWRLHTVGAEIHALERVGLVQVALCVDDGARRVPVAGAQRHRATNCRVGHTTRFGAPCINADHDAPQLCSRAWHDSDFDVSSSCPAVGRVGEQRFGLWPPYVAQSFHEGVASRFKCAPIEHTTNA